MHDPRISGKWLESCNFLNNLSKIQFSSKNPYQNKAKIKKCIRYCFVKFTFAVKRLKLQASFGKSVCLFKTNQHLTSICLCGCHIIRLWSPHVKYSVIMTVLDSGFHDVDSGSQVLDSRFYLIGFLESKRSVFRDCGFHDVDSRSKVLDSRFYLIGFLDTKRSVFRDCGFHDVYSRSKVLDSRFHLTIFQIPEGLF